MKQDLHLLYQLLLLQKIYMYGGLSFQVADELVAEFSDPNINIESPDPDNPSAVRTKKYYNS